MTTRLASLRFFYVAAGTLVLLGNASATATGSQQFSAYLMEGYRQMALQSGRSAENAAWTSYFVQRSALAGAGAVEPEDIENRQLDSWTLREAGFARGQLVARLSAGARQRQPLLAAIAQVNFDCWVSAPPRQRASLDRDECRRRFYFAFAGLAKPGRPAAIPEAATAPDVQAASSTSAGAPAITVEPLPLLGTAASQAVPQAPSAGAAPVSSNTPAMQRLAVQLHLPPPQQTAVSGPPAVACDRSVAGCSALAFTGPSADALIRDLREVGTDRGGTGVASAGGGVGNGNTSGGSAGGVSSKNGNSGSNSGSASSASGSESSAGTGGSANAGSSASANTSGATSGSASPAGGTATGSANANGSTGGSAGTASGAVSDAANATADAVNDAADATAGAVSDAANATQNAVHDASKSVSSAVHDVGNAVSGALHDTGKKLGL
jgi:hypothetical protein